MVNTPLDAANSLTMLQSLMQEMGPLGGGPSGVPSGDASDAHYHAGQYSAAGDDDSSASPHPSVIVYGHCVEALACVATLLVSDVPAPYITVVEAFPSLPSVSCFNDAEVDDAVIAELKELNINIYSHCTFNDWKYDEIEKKVGTELANELLKEIDPELEYALRRKYVFRKPKDIEKYSSDIACYKIPKFLQPLITCCVLPGGYNYLNVVAPGPQMPLEVAMCQDSYKSDRDFDIRR
ncbi:uncharacterized protein GBIM_13881 [Gryllus bimaculatus]|nr:uncharacterized protein GBIM_13881 [Gryllus bimaculatus]